MNIYFVKKIAFFIFILFSSSSFPSSDSLFSAGVPSLAPMLKNVTPAVVNIYTISEAQEKNNYIDDPFLRKFFNWCLLLLFIKCIFIFKITIN